MGKGNAFNPLAAAICSSIALGLVIVAGVNCSFLDVEAKDGDLIVVLETSAQEARTSASLGLICQGDFYDLQNDSMWMLSRIFLFASIGCGGISTLTAWSISTFALPSQTAWMAISATAALTSVLQVPMFVLFEAGPCVDYKSQQQCVLSTGSYFNICSIIFWFIVAVITQLLDPPPWVNALNNWRANINDRTADSTIQESRDPLVDSTVNNSNPTESTGSTFFANIRRWQRRRSWAKSTCDTFVVDEEQGVSDGDSDPETTRDFVVSGIVGRAPVEGQTDALQSFNRCFEGPPPLFSSDTATDGVVQVDSNETSFGDPGYAMIAGEPIYTRIPKSPIASDLVAGTTMREEVTSEVVSSEAVSTEMVSEVLSTKVASAAVAAEDTESKLTLGSLVSEVSGYESMLDNPPDISMEKSLAPLEKPLTGNWTGVHPMGMLGLKPKFHKGLARHRNRYSLLDDDYTEASLTISPPIEIFASSLEKDGDISRLKPFVVPAKDEKYLIHDWKESRNLESPSFPNILDDDVEPLLDFSDDMDDDESPTPASLGSAIDIAEKATQSVSPPKRSCLRKKRRRKKRRNHPSGRSVSSSPSLFDTVITEETLSDIEQEFNLNQDVYDFDPYTSPILLQRSFSAPNLASSFGSPNWLEGLTIDHVYMDDSLNDQGVRSDARVSPNTVKSSPGSTIVKIPAFREERAIRAGIHAVETVGIEEGESARSSPSSLDARMARIRRMQGAQERRPRSRTLDPPKRRYLSVSINNDSNDIALETLDLHLAEVQRPDGAEYGPEEGSL